MDLGADLVESVVPGKDVFRHLVPRFQHLWQREEFSRVDLCGGLC